MDAIERIKSQLSAAPVVLYMKGTPGFPAMRVFRPDRGRTAAPARPSLRTSIFSKTRKCAKR